MKSKAEENAKQIYDLLLNTLRRIEHLESFLFRCGENTHREICLEKQDNTVRCKDWSL